MTTLYRLIPTIWRVHTSGTSIDEYIVTINSRALSGRLKTYLAGGSARSHAQHIMSGESIVAMNAPIDKDVWKSDFLTHISHEIRTPLTTIIGYPEVMLSDPKLPPEAKKEYVEIIRNAGKRLSEFLDTYLDSEVVERNKQLSERYQEDVTLLAQRAIERVSQAAAVKSVSVSAHCETAIYLEGSEPETIVQILENIISNAIELAPTGGRVEIICTEQPCFIEIDVVNKDQGFLSISLTTVGKKFRWVQSPGIEIHHDGLGFAFAKHVVELEGGLLNIQGHKQGLTFTLQFPHNPAKLIGKGFHYGTRTAYLYSR